MTWHCPHCGTAQAEASRCWVCRRSSTSCATCRHFRSSVAAGTGFCGLDRRRKPLVGDEVRACWEDAALPITPDPSIPGLLDLLVERPMPDATRLVESPRRPIIETAPRPRELEPNREWVEVEA
jgi:hypothetical protein